MNAIHRTSTCILLEQFLFPDCPSNYGNKHLFLFGSNTRQQYVFLTCLPFAETAVLCFKRCEGLGTADSGTNIWCVAVATWPLLVAHLGTAHSGTNIWCVAVNTWSLLEAPSNCQSMPSVASTSPSCPFNAAYSLNLPETKPLMTKLQFVLYNFDDW